MEYLLLIPLAPILVFAIRKLIWGTCYPWEHSWARVNAQSPIAVHRKNKFVTVTIIHRQCRNCHVFRVSTKVREKP